MKYLERFQKSGGELKCCAGGYGQTPPMAHEKIFPMRSAGGRKVCAWTQKHAKKKRWLLPDMLQSLSMQAESRRHVRRERGYLLKSKRLPQAVKNHGSVGCPKPFHALKRFPGNFCLCHAAARAKIGEGGRRRRIMQILRLRQRLNSHGSN